MTTTQLADATQTIPYKPPLQQDRRSQQRFAGGAIFLYRGGFQPTTLGVSWNVLRSGTADLIAESTNISENFVKEHLEFIEDAFGLRVSRLAELFGVTRQAIYDWKQGKSLSKDNEQKLSAFHKAAQRFKEAGLKPDYATKHRTIGGELEFMQALEGGHDPVQAVEKLIVVLERGREQRERLEKLLKDRPEPKGSVADELPPHYPGE